MFDLKAKLLAQGLVTKEQVDKVTAERKPSAKRSTTDNFLNKEREKALASLKAENKGEQYNIIRRWVEKNRLDKESHVSLDCEKFFFNSKDNQVTWLTLRQDVIEQIKSGSAAVISYMSNHGQTHAVVPRDIGEDVGEVFPDWLRVLNDKT